MEDLLLKPEAAAHVLGIGRTKLYELMASREIPSLRIGRNRLISRKALEAYVETLSNAQAS